MKRTPLVYASFVLLALGLGTARLGAAETAAAAPNTLTPDEKRAGWQLLFDGQSLAGWKASENPGSFSVADGNLVVFGKRSHLFYVGPVHQHDFKNFELVADIQTFPKANSGVYFHTEYQENGWPAKGFEVQVNNSHSDPKRGAGLYNVQDNFTAPAKDGEWYTMKIRVEGKRVQTWVNGKPVVDFTEATPPAPPAGMPGRVIGHGTIAIQGHDPESRVLYRNIKIRVLP
jgi:hypothetical protein